MMLMQLVDDAIEVFLEDGLEGVVVLDEEHFRSVPVEEHLPQRVVDTVVTRPRRRLDRRVEIVRGLGIRQRVVRPLVLSLFALAFAYLFAQIQFGDIDRAVPRLTASAKNTKTCTAGVQSMRSRPRLL